MLQDPEIVRLVETILKARMPGARLDRIQVESGEDFDGEQVVNVWIESEPPAPSARERLAANVAVKDALMERLDRRFVFLNFHPKITDETMIDDEDSDLDNEGKSSS